MRGKKPPNPQPTTPMNKTYSVDFFIQKFSAIDNDSIGRNAIRNRCALFHCGMVDNAYDPTDEANALNKLLQPVLHAKTCWVNRNAPTDTVWAVNDGSPDVNWKAIGLDEVNVIMASPRTLLLAALNYIKSKQSPPQQVNQAQHECCHMWLECGVCMICSATKPVVPVEVYDNP